MNEVQSELRTWRNLLGEQGANEAAVSFCGLWGTAGSAPWHRAECKAKRCWFLAAPRVAAAWLDCAGDRLLVV